MMKFTKYALMASALAVAAASAPVHAQSTYSFDYPVGAGGTSGSITTDGTLGVLATANILDWSIFVDDSVSTFMLNGPSNSGRDVVGLSFTATASGLFFDFSNAAGDYVLFQNPNVGSNINFLCINDAVGACSGFGSSIVVGTDVIANRQFTTRVGVTQIGSLQVTAPGAVPEPATWAMLIFGFGMIGAGMRRRQKVAVSYA